MGQAWINILAWPYIFTRNLPAWIACLFDARLAV